MKKIILATALLLSLATPSYSQHYHHGGGYHGNGGGGNWAVPLVGGLIVGGIIGGAMNNNNTYYDRPRYRNYDQYCWEERAFDYYGRPYLRTVCNYPRY